METLDYCSNFPVTQMFPPAFLLMFRIIINLINILSPDISILEPVHQANQHTKIPSKTSTSSYFPSKCLLRSLQTPRRWHKHHYITLSDNWISRMSRITIIQRFLTFIMGPTIQWSHSDWCLQIIWLFHINSMRKWIFSCHGVPLARSSLNSIWKIT